MPEIMQLGPDDNDINPYLTPCPADYPPCPLCGEYPDMLESGHIICCNILVDNADAWFLLPRALTWTHEPPQVAGWYWCRVSKLYQPRLVEVYESEDGLRFGSGDSWQDQSIAVESGDFEWAGPIPAPIEP